MFKRKLFKPAFSKRVLPVILSVAMIFQSMPATALAAEEQTVVEDVSAEDSGGESTADETKQPEAGQSGTETSAEDAESSEEEASEEEASEEETKQPKADASAGDTDQSGTGQSGTTESSEGSPAVEEVDADEGSSAEDPAPAKDPTATKVVVDYEELRNSIGDYDGLKFDAETDTVFAQYNPDASDVFADIKGDFVSVEYDDEDVKDNLAAHLTYQWQEEKDGKFVDMAGGKVPHNAGNYQLVIKMPKIDDVCKESEPYTMNFRIDKREVTVDYEAVESFKPDTLVSDVIKSIGEDYSLKVEVVDEYGDTETKELNKDAYVKECKISIIRERDAEGVHKDDNDVLADSATLLPNEEYSIRMEITLKDEVNYVLSNTSRRLGMETNTATEIKVDKTSFSQKYGTAIDEEALKKEINASVVFDDDGEEATVKDAELKYQWLDADKKELENGREDVKNAGSYWLRISYDGKKGQYNAAKDVEVKVVISTIDVYIGDITVSGNGEYSAGMPVKNVLETVTGYKVYETGAETKTDVRGDDAYFWGTSYRGDEADTDAQSYEPVFVVQKRTKTNDTWGKWITLNNTDKLEKDADVEYRIVFSGRRTAYNGSDADINDSQENYRVDVTNSTIEANAKAITVVSDELEVDVTPMYDGEKGTIDNPITHLYDAKPFYGTKDAYKKAKIKGKEVNSYDLTYTWYQITEYGEVTYDDDKTETTVESSTKLTFNDVEKTPTPVDAGNYMVKVEYTDKETGATAVPEYVYYTIVKEDILIKPVVKEDSAVVAYYGQSVSAYLSAVRESLRLDTGDITYTIEDNTEGRTDEDKSPADAKNLENVLKYYEKYYNGVLTWYVAREVTEAGKTDYVMVEDTDTFKEGEKYYLCVKADWEKYISTISTSYGVILANYNNRYELDSRNEIVTDINNDKPVIRYENEKVLVTPKVTEGIEVAFAVDWSKITDTTKIYDGEPMSMSQQLKDAVTVLNAKTGDILDKTKVDPTYGWYWSDEGEYIGEASAVHAGDYYLTLTVKQNDYAVATSKTYYPASNDGAKTFTIKPSEITITPEVKAEIKAGTYINAVWNDDDDYANMSNVTNIKNIISSVTMDGTIVKADEQYLNKVKYFANTEISYPERFGWYWDEEEYYSVDGLCLEVTDKTTGARMNSGYLRGDRAYNVKFEGSLENAYDENETTVFYASDYKVVFKTVSFTAERNSSSVASGNVKAVNIYDSISKEESGYAHTITPRAGIPYSTLEISGQKVGGNYITLQITAPAEYTNVQDAAEKVIYESSIKNAGSVELETSTYYESNRLVIEATFDAAQEIKPFEITWEDGHTETFTVEVPKSLLMEDLTRAVAPKSLAFNDASAKMAVGEGQQLDLKITKAQMADIICIAYESSDGTVLTVSDSGYVTAIHSGKATVTAYAAYKNADDKIEPILNAKGDYAKSAKLNITVSKVSEVKGVKFEAHDTYAYIDYTNVPDGYRREVYVLEGDKKLIDFETELANVQNGNYDNFAARLFITASERGTTSNSTGKKFWGRIGNLKPNTRYSVYVRNVSGLRKFTNGEQIDPAEYYAGTTVSKLTTTKSQETGLRGSFKTSAEDAKQVKLENGSYYVNISAKSVQFNVEAKYLQKEQEDKDYADAGDYIWLPLKLSSADQKTYVNPKLTYIAAEYRTDDVSRIPNWKEIGYVRIDDYYYLPSSIAAIDKNGKISLKGTGWVYVYAYDAETTNISRAVALNIKADVDGLVGKAIKMKVGNTVWLSDYLTYKQKNIKLSSYNGRDLLIDYESNDAFEITPYTKNGNNSSAIDDYRITAKKPSGTLNLTVSDKTVTANGGKDITIKVQSSAIDPVKNLKAYDVYDTDGTIRFDYGISTGSDPNLKFRLEIKDQSGKVTRSDLNVSYPTWDYKKKVYTYSTEINDLTRLSSYTVSVTAIYEGYEAKAVSTKIKTTNIPASKTNAVILDANNKDTMNDGGDEILVYKTKDGGDANLSEYKLLKSGNTYTLDIVEQASAARKMKTDTLTWKSSNTKVATVKANPGTFTATFKALKKGTTQISVTSKITKKVIARWTVFVTAVGEADGYFGENIPDTDSDSESNNVDQLGAELLTLNNPLRITLENGEKRWIAFKAPEYGCYSVGISSSDAKFIAYDSDNNAVTALTTNVNNVEMYKGQTVYLLVSRTDFYDKRNKAAQTFTITATGIQYTSLTLADTVKVKGGSTVVFVAPEDNYYTFTAYKVTDGMTETTPAAGYPEYIFIEKGKKHQFTIGAADNDYMIKVAKAETVASNSDITVTLEKGETKYYKFTASEKSEYSVYTKSATERLASAEMLWSEYGGVDSATFEKEAETDTVEKKAVFAETHIDKNTTKYIKLTAPTDKAVTATLRIDKAAAVPGSVTITEDNGTKTMTYVAPKDGTYRFTANYTKPADGSSISVWISNEKDQYQTILTKGEYITLTIQASKKDTTVTVSAAQVEPTVVKAGEAAKPVSVGTAEETVKFTALEDGWYEFKWDNDKLGNVYYNTDSSQTGRGARSYYGKGNEIYLKAGTVLTFTLSASETVTANVSVEKKSVSALTDGKITLGKDETKRYSWTATSEGLYDISLTATDAQIRYSTTPDSDKGSYYDTNALSGYKNNGDTYYLTITANGTEGGSVDVKINKLTAQELTIGQEKSVEVAANSSEWVTFTARQKVARYQYSKADAAGFKIYESRSLGGGTESESFDNDIHVFHAGEKLFYRVVNTNTEKKTIKLKISVVTAADIADTKTETLKTGESKWYKFSAKDAGRYQITVSGKAGEKDVAISLDGVYDSLTATYASNSNTVQVLDAGKDIYIKVSNGNAEEASATVTIEKLTGSKLTLGTAAPVSVEAGKTQYLEYEVGETGLYTLTATTGTGAEQKAYSLPVTYYRNKQNGSSNTTPFTVNGWEKGDKILFEIANTGTAKIEASVTLAKETVTDVTEEAVKYTVKDGDTKYFRAKLGGASRYFMETSEVDEGLTLAVGTISGSDIANLGTGYVDFAPNGTEVLFKVTALGFEGEKSFKIKKGVVTPAEIKAGETKETSDLAANHKAWYSFTPTEEGRYTIKAGTATIQTGYNNNNTTRQPIDQLVTKNMVGKAIVYALYHTDSTKAQKLSLTVSKVTPAELTEASPFNVDLTKYEMGETLWLHFKAPADGRYTFAVTDKDGKDVSGISSYRYESLDSASSYWSWGTERCLDADDEFYLALKYYEKPAADFKVSVTSVKPATIKVSDTATVLNDLKADGVQWLAFTPDKTAKYTFTLTGVDSLVRYDRINDEDSSGKGVDGFYVGGTTAYYRLTAAADKPSVKITMQEMGELTVGTSTVNKIAVDQDVYVFFAASTAGIYSISAELTDCDAYVEGANRWLSNGEVTISSDKDHPVYIRLRAYAEGASAKFTISRDSAIEEIKPGDAKTVELTSEANVAWYKFTAAETGYYVFNTAGKKYSGGAYVNVLDQVTENAYVGNNKAYVAELRKGETKYIRIYMYNGNTPDEVEVTCTKVTKEAAFRDTDSVALNLNKGEAALVHWTAGTAGNYQLKYDAGGKNVRYWYYQYDNLSNLTSQGIYTNSSFSAKYEYAYNGRYLILEATEKNTTITVSASIEDRTLYTGSPETSAAYNEKFALQVSETGDYIIRFDNLPSYSVDMYDDDGVRINPVSTYEDEDTGAVYKLYELDAYRQYQMTVWNYSWYTYTVIMYKYAGVWTTLGGYSWDWDVSTDDNQEQWIHYYVRSEGFYRFGTDNHSAYMKLYKVSDGKLEVIGEKLSYYDDTIGAYFNESDQLWLQTYYNSYHSSGSYTVNIQYELSVTKGSWDISSYNDCVEPYLTVGSKKDYELSFEEQKPAKYTFYTSDYETSTKLALYQNGELVEEGYGRITIEELDPSESDYELRVTNYDSDSHYVWIYASWETFVEHEEYPLKLDDHVTTVSVSDGSEAWVTFTAPVAGIYGFYSTGEYDVKADLYENDLLKKNDDDSGVGNNFYLEYQLSERAEVVLKTYFTSHDPDEATYDVHVERLTDSYENATAKKIPISSDITNVSPGSIRQHMIFGDGKEYIFFSSDSSLEVDATIAPAFVDASANSEMVSLSDKKDDRGNFYQVCKLEAGRPYILTLENQSNSYQSVTLNIREYNEVDGGEIGETENKKVVTYRDAEYKWIVYTIGKAGTYQFNINEEDPEYPIPMTPYKVTEDGLEYLADYRGTESWFKAELGVGDVVVLKTGGRDVDGQQISKTVTVAPWKEEEPDDPTPAEPVTWEVTGDSSTKTVTLDENGETQVELNIADAEADTEYEITATDVTLALNKVDSDKNETEVGSFTDSTLKFTYVELKDGESYLLKVSGSANEKVTLTIKKVETTEEPETWTITSETTSTDITIPEDGSTTIELSFGEDAKDGDDYVIYAENATLTLAETANTKSKSAREGEADDETTATNRVEFTYSSGKKYELTVKGEAGKVILNILKVESEESTLENGSVTIKLANGDEKQLVLKDVKAGNNKITVEITTNEAKSTKKVCVYVSAVSGEGDPVEQIFKGESDESIKIKVAEDASLTIKTYAVDEDGRKVKDDVSYTLTVSEVKEEGGEEPSNPSEGEGESEGEENE